MGARRDPLHEPFSCQPTPDPSQEGNFPPGVAPLLGGAGGGFRGTRREKVSGNSLPGPSDKLASPDEERSGWRGVSKNASRTALGTNQVRGVRPRTFASVNRELASTPAVRRSVRLSSNDAIQ